MMFCPVSVASVVSDLGTHVFGMPFESAYLETGRTRVTIQSKILTMGPGADKSRAIFPELASGYRYNHQGGKGA